MGAIIFESLSANRVYLLSPLGFDPAYYAEARTLNLVLEKRARVSPDNSPSIGFAIGLNNRELSGRESLPHNPYQDPAH